MLDQLIQLDHQWFQAINQGLSNPFFDWLMPLLRNRYNWIPLYAALIYYCVKNFGKTGWLMILFFLLSFGIADYSSASIIKPAVERLRPCNEPVFSEQINVLVRCGSGYSFPSSHAANHFALALFFIVLFRKRSKWIVPLALLWAASIGFAQVYVGVHFPIDVTFGGLLGASVGGLLGLLFLKIRPEEIWKSGK
jgi:membrane-associated phospholipid phosphatase